MTTAPIGEWPGAAKPPNLGALRQIIITQYGLTQASILPGPRVSPSGHLSRCCHPAPDPKGFVLWTLTRRSPLWTRRKGLAALCTPAVLPETHSCPCSLSGVLFSLVRSMRYFTREHIRFGRSFFFQAAMSFDRNIVAEKRPLSRISKR